MHDGMLIKTFFSWKSCFCTKTVRSCVFLPPNYENFGRLAKAREVEVPRVPTETNLADIGTKHLPSFRLEFLKSLMGKSSENVTTFRADPGEQCEDGNSDDGQHG